MIAEDNILPPVLAGDSNQQTGKGGYFQFYEDAYADDGGPGEVTIFLQFHQQSVTKSCLQSSLLMVLLELER